MADADNTEPDGPAMQRLLDVRCHLRYIANDLHTGDRTAMHMQEVARECLEKTHSMRALEREHEARIRADERSKCEDEVAALRTALVAVRDDAYVLGEDCREHDGPIGACDECPHCDLARKIDAALAPDTDVAALDAMDAAADASRARHDAALDADADAWRFATEAAPAPAPDRAPTSREVMAAAQRAKQEVESWPAWKRTLSEPEPDACTHPKDRRIATYDEPGAFTCVACGLSVSTLSPTAATPREKLRRDLDANAKRWASYPAEVRAAMSTAEVFAVAPPAEPAAPDPWALPEPLYWSFLPSRGWSISSRNDDGGWALRHDADYLVVLLRRRNADEPDGPACWACGSCGCRNPKGGPAC